MAAITNRLVLRNKLSRDLVWPGLRAVLLALVVFFLVQRLGLWPLAALFVVIVELWPLRPGGVVSRAERTNFVLDRVPALFMGLSAVLMIAVGVRLAMQVGVAVLYVAWQVWWQLKRSEAAAGLVNLLLVQIAVFEAVFLMAAMWRTSSWIVLGLVWGAAYLSVYAMLSRRGERSAGVMAAGWAVTCVEVSWVLLLWLYVYTIGGGYILVPQPALILTAMAYCFGSIFLSQRDGTLSRSRLAEYLLIGVVLIAIVILGTSWRGSL